MNIHPAKVDDLPDILALLKASALPVAGIDEHVETTIIARDKGKIMGCAAVEVYGQAGLLRSLAVDAGRRGEGLGERLTKAALELARQRGVRTVYLLTTTASHFFPRFGFTHTTRAAVPDVVKTSAEFQGACPETAVVMTRRVGAAARARQ